MKKYKSWKGKRKRLNLGKKVRGERKMDLERGTFSLDNFVIIYICNFRGKHMINFLNKHAITSHIQKM